MNGEKCSVEAKVELARLDERIKSVEREMERSEKSHERALKIASDELARRLDTLNHAHAEAVQIQGTYLPRGEATLSLDRLTDRVSKMELEAENQRGKLWLPLMIVGVVAAALAATAVKLVFR